MENVENFYQTVGCKLKWNGGIYTVSLAHCLWGCCSLVLFSLPVLEPVPHGGPVSPGAWLGEDERGAGARPHPAPALGPRPHRAEELRQEGWAAAGGREDGGGGADLGGEGGRHHRVPPVRDRAQGGHHLHQGDYCKQPIVFLGNIRWN